MKPLCHLPHFFLPLAAACALLLPSCVRWNIGENILTARETRVALDYTQPVDGKLYRLERKGKEPRYFARLPEVRYRVMPDIVRLDMYDFKGYATYGKEATGREAFAEVKLDWYSSREPGSRAVSGLVQELSTLPAAAVAQPYAPERPVPLSPETPAVREAATAPGLTRRAVASTLSYTIDPALSIVCTGVFWCGNTVAAVVALPFLPLYYQIAPACESDERHQIPQPAQP